VTITYSITQVPFGATRLRESIGATSLADLLAEVGRTVDALPANVIEQSSVQLAAITAHLVDGAHQVGADGGLFTPSRDTNSTLSLRTLGRLATRTAGHDVQLDSIRVERVRSLLAELGA
jgi:hypothetical protein